MSNKGLSWHFFRSLGKAAWHSPTIICMTAGSLACAFPSRYGFLHYDAETLFSLVFPVSGTIVALSLPAAQISMTLVRQAETEFLKIITPADTLEKRAEYARRLASKHKENLEPAWRAAVYALFAFMISVGGSLGTFTDWPLSYLADFFALLALSFLVAAAIWFYPTVKFAFRLGAIEDLIEVADALGANRQPGIEAPPREYEEEDLEKQKTDNQSLDL